MHKHKDKLREMSKARRDRWPNTLAAQRLAKENARIERANKLEAERVKIDLEEEKLRAIERRTAIDRANRLMENESDKMKSHRARMLLADVLEERKHQVKIQLYSPFLQRRYTYILL